MSEKKHPYLIHLIYAGAFLLAVLAILAFFLYQNHEAAEQTKEKEAEAAQQAIQKAAKQAIYEEQKEKKIHECISQVTNIYEKNWAAACMRVQQNENNIFKNCLKQAKATSALIYGYNPENEKNAYASAEAQCEREVSPSANGQPDCALPNAIAQNLNDELANNKNECIRETD